MVDATLIGLRITNERRDYGYCMPIGQPWDYLVDELSKLKKEMHIPKVSLSIGEDLYYIH